MKYRRLYRKGSCVFLTMVLQDRRSSLLTENVLQFRSAISYVRCKTPFTINAIVVLPDHCHMLITLPSDSWDYSSIVRDIKKRFTFLTKQRNIWQRRFWEHTIREEEDFARHVDYIHGNPVKHGYVDTPKEWPYSSVGQRA